MKILFKLILLFLAVFAITGVILFYEKTRVELPKISIDTDQYLESLTTDIELLDNEKNTLNLDRSFFSIYHDIEAFEKENKISKKTANNAVRQIVKTFTPRYIEKSMNIFNSKNWCSTNRNEIITNIKSIEKIYSSKDIKLDKNTKQSFDEIKQIIYNYNNAKNLIATSNSGYRNLLEAERIINKSNSYLKNKYLSNCKKLCQDLAAVKKNLANSHYQYIEGQISRLSEYSLYPQDYYNNILIPIVDKQVEEYDKNAMRIYGTKRDLQPLLNKSIEYFKKASDYYEKK